MCNYDKKIEEKLKKRSTKTKKPLVEYKITTDNNLHITGKLFEPVFTEVVPEVERNKKKQ